MWREKPDNRGLTLVELIITVAIITILGGIVMMSVSILSGLPARQCADEVHSSLSKARIATMGKKEAKLRIIGENDCIYVQESIDGVDGVKNLVGKKGVAFSYTKETAGAEGAEISLINGDVLEFSFNRSSGAFSEISPGSNEYYRRLIMRKGGKEYVVELVPPTGKMSVSSNTP